MGKAPVREHLITLITTHAPTNIAQGEWKNKTLDIGGKQHKPRSPQRTKIKMLHSAQKENGRAVTFSGLRGQTRDQRRAPNGVKLNLHTEKSSG